MLEFYTQDSKERQSSCAAASSSATSGAGEHAAPAEDAEAASELVMAFVTGNGSAGGGFGGCRDERRGCAEMSATSD